MALCCSGSPCISWRFAQSSTPKSTLSRFGEAVELAVRQNPDLTLARLDEDKAREGIRVAQDPFIPRITVGSGLAYSNGFPMSIDGSAPSIVQARASQFIFNRPQQLAIAQAREDTRGAGLAVGGKREEVAYRVAELFLDAERAARIGALARKDAESQERVLGIVQAQVREGRALALAEKTAALNLARTRQTAGIARRGPGDSGNRSRPGARAFRRPTGCARLPRRTPGSRISGLRIRRRGYRGRSQ